jgi:hypothetical protein
MRCPVWIRLAAPGFFTQLLAKLKSGRPLTRHKRELVQAAADGSGRTSTQQDQQADFVRNQSELAHVLGLTRQ